MTNEENKIKNNGENWLLKAYKKRLEISTDYEKKLRYIVEASHNIAESNDIAEMMKLMLELAVKICNAQFACAALMGKSNEIFYSINAPAKDPGKFPVDAVFSRESGLSGLLMAAKTRYICNIAEGDKYLNKNIMTEYNIKNYISVPLLAKNRNFIGLLEVYNKHLFEPFDDNDAEILDILASFTSTAAERFRAYVELEKFGDEVQKVINEMFDAEAAFKMECEKFETAMKEKENINYKLEKVRTLAEYITEKKTTDIAALKGKATEILNILNNE